MRAVIDYRRPRPLGLGGWRRVLLLLKIRAKDRSFAAEVEAMRSAQPTIRDRQQELVRFYLNYEALVETLCAIPSAGATPGLEAGYQVIREWMIRNYPDVRRFVTAYLKYSAEDAQQGIDLLSGSADAFEALFRAPTLAAFQEHDDGNMISRIDRTRHALTMYGHHLRLLASES